MLHGERHTEPWLPGAQGQPGLLLPTAQEIPPEQHGDPTPPSMSLPTNWHLLQRHLCPQGPRSPKPAPSLIAQGQASAPVLNPRNCPQTRWAAQALGVFLLTLQTREASGFAPQEMQDRGEEQKVCKNLF